MSSKTSSKVPKPPAAARPRTKPPRVPRDAAGHFLPRAHAAAPAPNHAPTPAMVQLQEAPETTFTMPLTKVTTSAQLIHIVMLACVSSLVKLRHVFNSENYEYALYEEGDTVQVKPFQIHSLKRGVTERADRLLDLLEISVADTVQKGFLKTLRFVITEASASPDKRLEEWAIGLNYKKDPVTNERVVSDVHLLEEIHGERISMSHAKLNVGRFIGELAHVCNSVLPELPTKIKMYVELEFNDSRPDHYCPPGFHDYEADSTRLAQSDDWTCKTISVAKMKAPEHDAELKLTYLVPRHGRAADFVPSDISYNVAPVHNDSPVPCSDTSQEPLNQGQSILNVEMPPSQPEGSALSTDTTSRTPSLTLSRGVSAQNCALDTSNPNNTVESLVKESASNVEMKKKVQQMLSPLDITTRRQELQETQPRLEELSQQSIQHRPLFFACTRIAELDTEFIDRPPDDEVPNMVKDGQAYGQTIDVGCECDYRSAEGSMICCTFCRKFQHVHCLGYLPDEYDRIPTIHVCYRCLFRGKSPQALHAMREVSLRRRAIYLLSQKEYDNKVQFAKDLGCPDPVTNKVVRHLKENGVVASGSRTQRSIKLDVNMDKVREVYFNPVKGISDYLECDAPIEQGTSVPVNQHVTFKTPQKRGHEDTSQTDDGLMPKKRKRKVLSQEFLGSHYSTPKGATTK